MNAPNPSGSLDHSVVVPTYQRRDLVVANVEALARQDHLPLEVVVIVDGSTDGTGDALRALKTPFPLHVVEQANAGQSRGRNRGAAMVTGDLILFLDDDMVAAPDLLIQLARLHASGADAVVGHIPVLPASLDGFLARGLAQWAVERRQRILAAGGALTRGDLLTGLLSVRRAVFESLGGFDEQFTRDGSFGGEDTDFGRRLLDAGHRVVFGGDAVAHQHYVVTPKAYLKQWHGAGSADVAYLRKYPDDLREVFLAKRPHTRANKYVIRPLARVPLVRDAAALALRRVALGAVARRPDDARASRLFFKARNLEYWRGVESAGGLPRPRPVRVLCYHAVSDLSGSGRLAPYGVPADMLARQLRLLSRAGFRFVTQAEVLRAVRGEPGVPRRAVLVTFDDCYHDLLDEGVPVLHSAARVPAVAYAVADRLGATNDWEAMVGAPELRLLDVDGLRALRAAGLSIGVHGATHRPLTAISGQPDVLGRETAGATTALRQLELDPHTFAYPHGEHDAAARAAIATTGLEAAFTVEPGLVRPGADPFRLPRVEVLRQDGDGVRFLLKVALAGRLTLPDPRVLARRTRRALGGLRHGARREPPLSSSRRPQSHSAQMR